MKTLLRLLSCLLLLGLAACDVDRQLQQNTGKQLGKIPYTMQMHHLHMLVNHALQMAAQGADMKLLGKEEHGQALLAKAAELLQRAMSGLEMAKLHQQGRADSPFMMMTHKLSDTAQELIGLMQELSGKSEDQDSIRMFNHAIEVAATGSSLIMLGQQGMAGNIDLVMVNHGQSMLGEASSLLYEIASTNTAYSDAARTIVQLLIGIPENPDAAKPG